MYIYIYMFLNIRRIPADSWTSPCNLKVVCERVPVTSGVAWTWGVLERYVQIITENKKEQHLIKKNNMANDCT